MIRCTTCASLAVLAVKPGHEPERQAGILLRRGVPDRAWCATCWPALRPIGEVVAPIVRRALKRRRQA